MLNHNIRRGLTALLACLIGAAVAAAEAPAKPKIEWKTDLWPAYQQAVKDQKPLVIYFYTDNSEWCDKMTETLADDRVQQFADRAIFVRVNGEKDEDAKGNVGRLKQQLTNFDRYPYVAVLQPFPDKLVDLGPIRGYWAADQFVPRLEKSLGQATDPAAASK